MDHANQATLHAYEQLKRAIADVPLDARPAEIADAALVLALEIAEATMTPRSIARVMMRQAERYLGAAAAKAQPDDLPTTVTAIVHSALENAARVLQDQGLGSDALAPCFFAFGSSWLVNVEGTAAAAERLYRIADALVGRGSTQH